MEDERFLAPGQMSAVAQTSIPAEYLVRTSLRSSVGAGRKLHLYTANQNAEHDRISQSMPTRSKEMGQLFEADARVTLIVGLPSEGDDVSRRRDPKNLKGSPDEN